MHALVIFPLLYSATHAESYTEITLNFFIDLLPGFCTFNSPGQDEYSIKMMRKCFRVAPTKTIKKMECKCL